MITRDMASHVAAGTLRLLAGAVAPQGPFKLFTDGVGIVRSLFRRDLDIAPALGFVNGGRGGSGAFPLPGLLVLGTSRSPPRFGALGYESIICNSDVVVQGTL